jgi:hypothetical protein
VQRHLGKAKPRHQAPHVTGRLRKLQQSVDNLSVEQAKIAGIVRQGHIRQRGQNAVERCRAQPFGQAIAGAPAADPVDDLRPTLPQLYQSGYCLGGVLQIAVERDDRLAWGIVQPGSQRGLVTKTAR